MKNWNSASHSDILMWKTPRQHGHRRSLSIWSQQEEEKKGGMVAEKERKVSSNKGMGDRMNDRWVVTAPSDLLQKAPAVEVTQTRECRHCKGRRRGLSCSRLHWSAAAAVMKRVLALWQLPFTLCVCGCVCGWGSVCVMGVGWMWVYLCMTV